MNTALAPTLDDRGIILKCQDCGQANRVPFEKVDSSGHCAKCKATLPMVEYPIEVMDGGSFRALIGRSAVPVLVDFWAPWCGPCRMVAPDVERLAAEAKGRFLVAKVNTEEAPDVAGAFSIRSIPTFMLFQKGHEFDRVAGALPGPQLRAFVQRAL